MDSVLASSLSGYSIMTTEGAELGELENITVDPQTGRLQYLRVEPFGDEDGNFQWTDDDRLLIPAEAVTAINDYLLVEPDEPDQTEDPVP